MPRRSRSRSPRRDRRRSRSPDRSRHRDRDRERDRERRRSRTPPPPPPRYRSRSRTPPRRRSRSRSSGKSREPDAEKKPMIPERPKVDEEVLATLPPEEADMMRMMGFSSFDSTKGKKVEGNDIYVAHLVRKRRYRQYMNRRGGFNRPLDFIA